MALLAWRFFRHLIKRPIIVFFISIAFCSLPSVVYMNSNSHYNEGKIHFVINVLIILHYGGVKI